MYTLTHLILKSVFHSFNPCQKNIIALALGPHARAAIMGSNRVIRGGSWNNNAQNCRSANRNNNDPGNRNNNVGFRLVFVP